MADLYEIGRSGLSAARTQLAVTGENIANVETEGYKRRDVLQAEIAGSQASPLIRGADPQGVTVLEVRRAFDELLAERVRIANGSLSAAQGALPHLERLELTMQPGAGGIPERLSGFFDAVSSLAGSPADTGLRNVVMEAGDLLAGTVSELSETVGMVRRSLTAEAKNAIGEANEILAELSEIFAKAGNQRITSARNPLLDRRDQILGDLSGIMDIHVEYEERGQAVIRMGNNNKGPILLSEYKASYLTLADDGRVHIAPPDPNDPDVTRAAAAGILKGLASAAGSIDQAISDINHWAQRIATDVNAVHSEGIDSEGRPGGKMFDLSGWTADAAVINRGQSNIEIEVLDADLMPEGPLELTRDDAAGLWRMTNTAGDVLGEGASVVSVPGLLVRMTGSASDGDRYTLKDTSGSARHMRLVITDADQVAAAAALRVAAAPANLGSASLRISPAADPASGAEDLSTLMTGASGDAISFLSAGVVGQIPADVGESQLVSLSRAAMLEFAASGDAQGLSVTVPSGSFTFSGGPMPAAEFAAALNDGSLTGPSGETLSDLGFVASAEDGAFAIAARAGVDLPTAASLSTTAGASSGVVVADAADAADLAIFTREGRQIAGAPLDPDAATALLTEANGFYADAVYVPDMLNRSGAYGGLGLERMTGQGDPTVTLGTGLGVTTWSGVVPANARAAGQVVVDWGSQQATIDTPQGASAKTIASLLNDAVPGEATAQTSLALDAPTTGTVRFEIISDNVTPYVVQADVGSGGLSALAAAVNAGRAATGVTAEVSPDDGRLHLRNSSGETVTLGALSHSGGGAFGITRLGATGQSLGAPTSLAGDGTQSARVEGTVRLSVGADFTTSENGTLRLSQRDVFSQGVLSRTTAMAGAQQTLTLAHDGALDGVGYGSTGAGAVSLSITGGDGRVHDYRVDPALSGAADTAEAGAVLAAALREEAPASRLTGAAMATLPPDAAQLGVQLGSQTYRITMEGGAPVVTGPEEGRVTARFDASNRLIVETEGGHLDGAALTLATDPAEAARFGMGLTHAPQSTLIGAEIDGTGLPASFDVSIGGTDYTISATAGGLSVPTGFPGSAGTTPEGRMILSFDARLSPVRIAPQSGAAAAGFDTLGAEGSLANGAMTLTATDGRVLDITAQGLGDATRVSLTDLPDEELLVVMQGSGALRLAGDVGAPVTHPPVAARELRVMDAEARLVGLFDAETGASLATRTLDASGRADLGGLTVTLSGALETGDLFRIEPNSNGAGDSTNIERMADLVHTDTQMDRGGFAEIFAGVMSDIGAQVAAGRDRVDTAQAMKDGADKAESERSAVDLDTEAARLLQNQQAYQANAQVISVARQIFDTLINAL